MPSKFSVEAIVRSYYKNNRSIRATARVLGVHRRTVDRALDRAGERNIGPPAPIVEGSPQRRKPLIMPLPTGGRVARYIVTAAQNNTHVHEPTLKNLIALADYYDATLIVSKFTYNKSRYKAKSVKPGSEPTAEDCSELWYDEKIIGYCPADADINDIMLAPGLMWCARANIEPTASRPLRGFETYAGSRVSGIFPHPRLSMQAIPVMPGKEPRHNYTTGCVTQQNYIQKRAGLVAEHHHTYGGLLVEVDHYGRHFVRQLNVDAAGVMYDLCLRIDNGKVGFDEDAISGITWGDVHVAQVRPEIFESAWGANGMLDTLKPKRQYLHDLYDMYAQNHHDSKNFFRQFELHTKKKDNITNELRVTAVALSKMTRPWTETLVVHSNHDDALDRWIISPREGDMVNAELHAAAKYAWIQAIKIDTPFMALEWAINEYLNVEIENSVRFLAPDESSVCQGIECGIHGHVGTNGTKGTPNTFRSLSVKLNIGHFHAAGIVDGCYYAGVCAEPDYVRGPRSHSYSHILIYRNGKRAIVTMYGDGQWRARELVH